MAPEGAILLDTSLLVAWRNERDEHHAAAQAAMMEVAGGRWSPVLLPEYVLVEVVTVLAARRGIARAAAFGQELLENADMEFVPCSDLFMDAFLRFSGQRRFRFSLTDAALLVLAERRGATHIATFDEDFRKAPGIRVLPA